MGLNLTVDTKNLNPAFIEQLERKLKRDWQNHINNAAAFTLAQAQTLAPVRTGELRKSIETELLPDGFFVGSKLRYAGFQEYGTKFCRSIAYLRRAVAAMILKFKNFRQV